MYPFKYVKIYITQELVLFLSVLLMNKIKSEVNESFYKFSIFPVILRYTTRVICNVPNSDVNNVCH